MAQCKAFGDSRELTKVATKDELIKQASWRQLMGRVGDAGGRGGCKTHVSCLGATKHALAAAHLAHTLIQEVEKTRLHHGNLI